MERGFGSKFLIGDYGPPPFTPSPAIKLSSAAAAPSHGTHRLPDEFCAAFPLQPIWDPDTARNKRIKLLPEETSLRIISEAAVLLPPEHPRLRFSPAAVLAHLHAHKPKDGTRAGASRSLGERMRRLDKLMPWGNKLDATATLEEACKYIKFLAAQVRALSWMPVVGALSCSRRQGERSGLEKLNRQQTLEVIVNSPALQEKLYGNGWCVVSAEQIDLLRKVKTENGSGHFTIFQ